MAETKDYKVVKVPKGKKRLNIVRRSKSVKLRDDEYQREVEEDFDQDRHLYEEICMHGVWVKVKVAPK